MTADYPALGSERTRWILSQRGQRNTLEPSRPYAFLAEEEPAAFGSTAKVAAIFLTNRECPWKCAMCDLWRNTTATPLPPGSIPAQMEFALAQLPPATVLKLYNSGSFFDPGAIPRADWPAIAALCRSFQRVIVECHPRLIGPSVLEFAALLPGELEVALGLETAHPQALNALNKRISVRDFENAARFLKEHNLRVRAFLLINPPFVPAGEQARWLRHSLRAATDCGADVLSLIPLRGGNGAMEALIQFGQAREPTLAEIEAAQELALERRSAALAFCDTWDLQRFARCPVCLPARTQRIHQMNISQLVQPRIPPCG